MKLGVAFAWHVHPFEELLALVQRAEALGYTTAYVDGDATMLSVRRNADVLDGWTVTTALLARTRRIEIASMRLVHHWNAARLAQAVASAECIAPGRLRFLISIGDRPNDGRFGLPELPPGARIAWLDETLTVLRRLWSGDTVTFRGRFVTLDRARVRPTPPDGRIPITVAGRGPRLLGLVAKHADAWDVNLPPLRGPVEEAAAHLAAACQRQQRFADVICRSMLIHTRIAESSDPAPALKRYRELNPWFHWLPDEAIEDALVLGSPQHCRLRLSELARELHLELPIADLSGLDAEATRSALEALAPANNDVDAGT